jgi:hypothetical protein
MTMIHIRSIEFAKWATGSVAMALALAATAAIGATPAYAAWSAVGSGAGGAAATTMPTGTAPNGTTGIGSVTVSWNAVSLGNGASVAGYVIKRYDATTGALQTVSGTCSGIVTATTCKDQPVPAGTWVYTDTPVLNNWNGGESPASASITVRPT